MRLLEETIRVCHSWPAFLLSAAPMLLLTSAHGSDIENIGTGVSWIDKGRYSAFKAEYVREVATVEARQESSHAASKSLVILIFGSTSDARS